MRKHTLTLVAIGIVIVGGFGVLATQDSEEQKSTTNAACGVDSKLVNSCRPWIGAEASNYPGVATDHKSQLLAHESRVGKQVDIVHFYASPGDVISTTHKYFTDRGTYLMLNWKPVKGGGTGNAWRDANGSNATVNTNIDKMANSIKAISPKKIFLTVYHEPENDVSPGGSPSCGSSVSYKGNMGTTAEYVAMWQNVRARFDALGVNNVVWAYTPMSYSNWNCMKKEMWPGNNLVDWITYDAYVYNGTAIASSEIGQFYTWLTQNTDASHAYTSKPWGLNEWGAIANTQTQAYKTYDDMLAAYKAGTYPKLQMFNIWDNIGASNIQVQYSASGVLDQTEQQHYNAFVDAVLGSGTSTPPPPPADTSSPTVAFSAPAANASVSKSTAITAAATDNVGVTKVAIYVDATLLATDTSSGDGWGASWDTTNASNGSHTLKLVAFDAAGNSAQTTRTVMVNNEDMTDTGSGSGSNAGGGVTTPVITVTTPTGEKVVDAKTTPAVPQGSQLTLDTATVTSQKVIDEIKQVEFYDTNKLIATVTTAPFTLDTKLLTPGEHTITQKTYYKDGRTTSTTEIVTIASAPGVVNTVSTAQSYGERLTKVALVVSGIGLGLIVVGVAAAFVLIRTGRIDAHELLRLRAIANRFRKPAIPHEHRSVVVSPGDLPDRRT